MQDETGAQDSIKQLQAILTLQQQKPVDYAEAREVGATLIAFFQTLATDPPYESAA